MLAFSEEGIPEELFNISSTWLDVNLNRPLVEKVLWSSPITEPIAIIFKSRLNESLVAAGALVTHPVFRLEPKLFEAGLTYGIAAADERFEIVLLKSPLLDELCAKTETEKITKLLKNKINVSFFTAPPYRYI
jgi:hypothetical protein